MNTKERLRRSVVARFHNPTGVGGHVAGWIMSHRSSNIRRNRWAVDLLDPQPDERVIELGCGPGVALAAISDRLVEGVAVGVDHSPVMVGQARRRNAAAVRAGRVQLACAAVEDLLPVNGDPATWGNDLLSATGPFDAALAVNSTGFWDQPDRRLVALRRHMRPEARLALVTQPRCPGATAETSRTAGSELTDLLDKAGFIGITSATLDLDPPAVYVQAIVPDP